MSFTEPTIRTASGIAVPLLNPAAEHIMLNDIARGMASVVRDSGSRIQRESHALHALVMCDLLARDEHKHFLVLDPCLPIAALLADAHVAYLGTVPDAVAERIPAIHTMREVIQHAVADALGLPDGIFAHGALQRVSIAAKVIEQAFHVQLIGTAVHKNEFGRRVAGLSPADYGYHVEGGWPDVSTNLLTDARNTSPDRAEMLWILRFEAEVRRLEERRPEVAEKIRVKMAEAAKHGMLWRPDSPARVVAMCSMHAPVPVGLARVAEEMVMWCARDMLEIGTEDASDEENARVAMHILRAARDFRRLATHFSRTDGPFDRAIATTDPARSIYELEQDSDTSWMRRARAA